MSPAWRRTLSRHKGRTLVELCRRPKIQEQIAGFIVGFSDAFIVLHRLDWNTFTLDGYTVLRQDDLRKKRFFSRASFWQNRAVKQLGLRPVTPERLVLTNWAQVIFSAALQYTLIDIECEIATPDKCDIGVPLQATSKTLVLHDLNSKNEWTGIKRIKLDRITRIDFGSGYERALAATAPSRVRPPGYFENCFTEAEVKQLNRFARFSPQRMVR